MQSLEAEMLKLETADWLSAMGKQIVSIGLSPDFYSNIIVFTSSFPILKYAY